ncbi:insulinase family protein [Acinetobacter cumulans]|uniref:Insulinase family protein n=1 Tax=Acinetobacter cumulans TaxID=2136182 RepID=A0ABX9U607_9GAMM|nr:MULTISPECIES: pitrilysin family protein [Acinetobacter]NWK75319.1 insulinase family protein [Acinetobacter sp. SwsAc6]QCO22878.1 insulinase family protein [Acinetobacter cumulans]RFS34645.1 insulinase family protein [Acinetobacter sp. SWAC5]RKG45737.1 insulinase family protein [Acinetobacter cumulans]RKG47322.1 insulinase family protein [Acinetobacter cumulans]
MCSITHADSRSQLSRTTFETTLKNGLKVIIREDHRSPMVMTHIWYKVGSTDESGNLLGISHVLEHMMFKGTNKVPNDEFTRLSRLYGGSINAATFTNYTNYYQLYPKTYFPMALELEADRMSNLKLKQSDFEPEIKVVMEERRQRTDDNPRSWAFERFKWLAYPTSHYRQPVIGYMKNLQNIQLDDLKQWYKTWYAPNNAILVIVGDVNAEQALLQVQKYFGDIPAQKQPPRNDVLEFERPGYRHLELSNNVQIPNLYMAWNVHSLSSAKNPQDAYVLNIIRNLLDSGISSRLQERLIRDKKVLTTLSVSYDPYNRGDSLFSISAMPASGVSLENAQKAIQAEIDSLKNELIDATEMDRIRTKFIANMIYNQDDIVGQAKMIGNLEVNDLSFRLMDELPRYYENVSPQDVQKVANTYFVRDNLTTMYLTPEQPSK